MKTSNRGILNTLYILTGIWLLVFLLGRVSLALIAIPPLLIYAYVFPTLSLMASFYYFFTNKKWFLERKLAACIFILSFLILFILPRILEYEKLIKTEPTNTVITEFIKLETIGLPNKLDLPATKVNYQNESKSLDISITINSQAFIRDSIYANSSPELIAAVIRNVLYNYSVHIPQDISNVTLVPQSINFYTYWDDVLLLGTHFSRDKKRYRIKEPYPELTIWGTPSEWYFEYGNDHKKLNVSLKPLPTNKIKIDFKPYIKTAAGHL